MVNIKSLLHFRQKPTLANENRTTFTDNEWNGVRKQFIGQVAAGGVLFMLWFLACCSYLFGTLYGSSGRHAALHILAVDYDGGVVGESMAAAYQQLKGPGFFTLTYKTPEEYPTEEDMYHAVWEGKYWGAISANQGASDRLSAALQGGEAAATYDPTGALHYTWNQQAYTAFANSAVQSHMQQLVAATRIAYNKINGTRVASFVNQTDPAAVQTFLNPISSTVSNIKKASFGPSILLNTVSMAMPVLQQFFFLLVLNGAARQHQLYNKMTVFSSLIVRRVAGLVFTLGASLCQAGYYWAFREDWGVSGSQFVLTWMTLWLLMHIHLLILDSISTVAPMPVMPFVVLLWVFLNIASTLSPLELQAGFYHWGIALPGHNAYSVMVTIWTGGADNHLYRALPILFAWWLVANWTTSLAHIRACHLAKKLENEEHMAGGHVAKDEEAGHASKGEGGGNFEGGNNRMSMSPTLLERQRTIEEVALEQRQVYGPSIPPFTRRATLNQ
ncbi:hypothetical protein BS50DRAFT_577893 [Corynespora cassiicola Philippines]|uniref:DUF3533 domain-containing protein n=1 Tax=Corynespora cassiicola Philippines TaxID=1448308 RepID=A0A2T2N9I3_CORCC|nr:hypothetical protein BS50DRAFT_577893 [Corynespora cassiicola Philippines]